MAEESALSDEAIEELVDQYVVLAEKYAHLLKQYNQLLFDRARPQP